MAITLDLSIMNFRSLVPLPPARMITFNEDKSILLAELLNNDDEIIIKFEPADLRESFHYDFKQFSKALMGVMYSRETSEFAEDYKFLCQKRQLLINAYEGVKPSIRSFAPKIQELIDENVRSKGISDFNKGYSS